MKRTDNFIDVIKEAFTKYWEQPALTDYSTKLTYTHSDICQRIAKNHIIFNNCQIAQNDKIAVMGRNSSHWAISYLSIVTSGYVVVPILDDFNPIDIEHILNHSETAILMCDSALWKTLNEEKLTTLKYAIALDNFEFVYCADNAAITINDAERIIDTLQYEFDKIYPEGVQKENLNYVIKHPDEMISLNYTSGTTSLTKGVMLSSNNIVNNITYLSIEFNERNIVVNNTVCVLPMAHAYGLAFAFLGPLIDGTRIYFLGKLPSPNLMMEACKVIKPELLVLVPLIFEKIYKYNVAPIFSRRFIKIIHEIKFMDKILHRIIVSKIKKLLGGNLIEVVIGGSTFNAHIEKFLYKGGFPFTVGYGMTECAPLISYIQHELFEVNSVGRILKHNFTKIRIVKEQESDKSGEIQIYGENVMIGYFKDELATKEAFTSDGWLKTGDLGTIDQQGNIFIKGRSKTMILGASGENIYPESIESKLVSLPFVAECIVIQNNKSKLEAYVYPDYQRMKTKRIPEKDLAKIMEQNKAKLNRITAKYENITALHILESPLPKTPKNTVKRYGIEEILNKRALQNATKTVKN